MARGGTQHRLSDLQRFIVINLREQARLKAKLARMRRFTTGCQRTVFAPHAAQLRADLLALDLAIELRRQQEEISA
jgi:hypothetical protein